MRPVVRNIRKGRQSISVFRGINRSINTAMSKLKANSSSVYMEFKNTKNMTLDDYPAIRTRDKRVFVYDENGVDSNILATAKGLVRFCNDGKLRVGESEVQPASAWSVGVHQLIEYGNFVVILPEKRIVNLVDLTVKEMENHFNKSGVTVELDVAVINTSVTPTGKVYIETLGIGDIALKETQCNGGNEEYEKFFGELKVGDMVEDKTTVPATVYLVTEIKSGEGYEDFYNENFVVFTRIDNVYTRLSIPGIGKGFKVGDFVRLKMRGTFPFGEEKGLIDNTLELLEVGEDYVIVNSALEQSQSFKGTIELQRCLPVSMDFMVSCNNRLWACSNSTNMIYACKLGDPTNWEAYNGLASGSYFTELGSEGEFTGITASGQSVYFFKENCIHRIYGTKPSNYTVLTYPDMGVKKGSEKSVTWLKDRLFYNSPAGVCVYSPGGEPQIISQEAFGNAVYTEAVAGKHGNKYMISLKREDGVWELFVYDTESGQWLLEGEEHLRNMVSYRDVLYFCLGDTDYLGCITDTPDNLLKLEGTKELITEGDLEWYLESGDLYDAYSERKYIQKVELTLEIEKGEVSFWISKDGKPFERVKMLYATRKESKTIPLHPGRCHNFRIRLEGRGKTYLYGITLTTEEGSSTNGRF